MQITTKYWRTARALALFRYGDADVADTILACANGDTHEPDDMELSGGDGQKPKPGSPLHAAMLAERVGRPDYVFDKVDEHLLMMDDYGDQALGVSAIKVGAIKQVVIP